MVVLSQPDVDTNLAKIQTCKPASNTLTIPIVDLTNGNAKTLIVQACKSLGFFKVINHRVSMEFLDKLEAEVAKFFRLPEELKEKAGPPNPFGYGSKRIGPNGDVGWVEYLLFSTNPDLSDRNPDAALPETLRGMVDEYVAAVKDLACEVFEMIADELEIPARDILSRLIRAEKSDSVLRINHYPPRPELEALTGRTLIGFGEHTDLQMVAVLRSNDGPGLEVCSSDGAWLSVPSDPTAFFFNVGDTLQIMTNGRFRSVKHRVLADSSKSRLSMIFLGSPPLSEKVTPLAAVMDDGEESLYKEFTWSEYKNSAYKTRLSDDRLSLFEKSADAK